MKIAIIGAGAMGCLYGAKLSESDRNQVLLVDVWEEHVKAINDHGLFMEEDGKLINYKKVRAVSKAEDVGPCDLAIVFVKSTMTGEAVRSNRSIFGAHTIVLTLQNGLGNVELIEAELGDKNIIAGTTAHGATMLGPGRIRHAGAGKTVIGELTGDITDRLVRLADMMSSVGLETEVSDNVMGLIWDKLLVNVGINALTAITGLHNGQLLDYPELEALLEAAVEEAHQVALAKGICLQYEDPVSHTKDVCKATAANKSSMLQDILNRKKTEIEMINGAVCREGRSLGITTPVNSVLTNLILYKQRYIKTD
ncbi:MAG TPA: 2-dehydropantoate 2-reductase [Bacillota bacterium]|jgi:2-dehydropantoate 2-reductase|nr:2-dehydropantoate 2-reductase [Clostridiales bacterium UBA9856]HOA41843.1 2-dehydropantoate 2-reductase [Bacillota bacterium]HPZ59144.1 2-dehydropantoate 2-reductase [Bacillota bacterium]HQC83124.1 2-dehydropantoate 2-reductase [Bacillota bacterium]